MLIRPAIGDTDPIRYRRPNPDGQFSGNILDEAMRPRCVSAPGLDADRRRGHYSHINKIKTLDYACED